MSSRKRSWIQDTRMYRGVLLRNGVVYEFTGPYDTPGKAKTSVTQWKNAGGYGELAHGRDGFIEWAEPTWAEMTE